MGIHTSYVDSSVRVLLRATPRFKPAARPNAGIRMDGDPLRPYAFPLFNTCHVPAVSCPGKAYNAGCPSKTAFDAVAFLYHIGNRVFCLANDRFFSSHFLNHTIEQTKNRRKAELALAPVPIRFSRTNFG